MEFEKFSEIRQLFCMKYADVTEGKMMSSEAIHYKNKVFVFFSRKKKMVFKLGKGYPMETIQVPLAEFNPFKNKGPLAGWYEVDFEHHDQWETLTQLALNLIQNKQA
ncbi:hypothetical protein J0X14_01485 [Muricauda sp. CAU 1633]|uniref:hypothetical protein n=1 Tax=Allomuricauda sp. CAU 1633 TaxID=2816036 RepID=UPI001A8FE69D|nr:hypothetical protein [Muricauda sp. CAU 1633]MBO0320952.1 hypothetical protein [Muricauda sp. CAU 1633]